MAKSLILSLLSVTVLAGAVAGERTAPTTEPITVDLEMAELRSGGELHPLAWITITNRSRNRLGVSKSFYTDGEYIFLMIESVDDKGQVVFPGGEQDLFSAPVHRCLTPGQSLEVGIDLLSWRAIVGAERVGPVLSFDLQPGHYRAKAVYLTEVLRLERRFGCKPFRGRAESEWVDFKVGGTG